MYTSMFTYNSWFSLLFSPEIDNRPTSAVRQGSCRHFFRNSCWWVLILATTICTCHELTDCVRWWKANDTGYSCSRILLVCAVAVLLCLQRIVLDGADLPRLSILQQCRISGFRCSTGCPASGFQQDLRPSDGDCPRKLCADQILKKVA